jgi:hypothetical protein
MPNANKHDEPSPLTRHERMPSRKSDSEALAKLMDEWMREDDSDQRETFEFLRRALDEDRPEGYKFFS